MLQLIRGTVGSWIVKILFILLIISFAIWGIGDIFRGKGPAQTVAEIGPVKVQAAELDREFRNQLNRLRPMFGGQLDAEQAKQLGLVDQTLDQMVQKALFDLAAKDTGLLTGDELVRRRLQAIPGFRNEKGQFDPELLRRALASNSMNEGALIAMIREETGRELVVGAVTSGAAMPATLVDALYRVRNEKRVAETVTLTNDTMPEPATPDDAELTRYHEDKAVRFTAPEFRAITAGVLTVEDYAKTLDLTEDDIKQAYESRADEFQTPERRTFQQVLVDSEDQAKRVADAARAPGGDLAAAAAAEKASVATLGPSTEAEVPEIGVSVFAVEANSVSEPFKSDLGWHVIKVIKLEPAHTRTLTEVHDEVAVQLRKDRAADTLPRLVNMVEDALAGGATIEEAVKKFQLRLVKLDAVDTTGAKPDGSKIADVPALAQILQSAFNLNQGVRGQLTDAGENVSFVARADSITPSHLKPLAEVKNEVIAAWKADRKAEAAAKKAEDVETRLKAGGTAADVAKNAGAVAAVTEPLARDPGRGADAGKLPPQLLKALFAATPGEVVKAATADGQVVARLKDIVPADPAAAKGAVDGLREAERRTVANDLLGEFGDGLRSQFPVRVNRDRINQMFSSNN